MALNHVIDFFKDSVKHTFMGEALPYYSVKNIAKCIKKNQHNTYKWVHTLIDSGVLLEHPLNSKMKEKRFRINRDMIEKI